jgi:predicted RNase H-like HicB family nuclease
MTRQTDSVKLQTYSAVIRRDESWWIGWVEEIPGVNSQGKTRAELLKNLRSALREVIREKLSTRLRRVTNVEPLPDAVRFRLYREREDDADSIRQFIGAHARHAKISS